MKTEKILNGSIWHRVSSLLLMLIVPRRPLPTSPIEGEVMLHSCGSMAPHPLNATSPLMEEARRGWISRRR